MSQAKFTPGPWVVYKDLPTDVVVSQSGECSLATLDCGCGSRKTQRANAHLIAAAPELYVALEALIKECDMCGHPDEPEAVEIARSALAKARGEA